MSSDTKVAATDSNRQPATPEELLCLLDELGIEHETHHHEPVFTVEESEHVTATIPGGHTKNLFVKDKKGNFFLIVAGNHARIPLNRIHGLIGAQGRVSFCNGEKLMELLGVAPGSVNAFAPMNDHENRVKVIIDEPLLENDQINCHPLINDKTTTISREDLLRFLEHVGHPPQVIRLSETQGD
ncbi:prolyl-tRNA synthetase associated domain-containing protein [Salaquimonas pukyongi]|uniref:prolyl-tRNA synthetase associated domain-containing protein n=1 Tax=Salaquimonas pukyongi TaxID=2712698 RepID=UPI00096B887C|nr:YbaK/EbsC family protein [Salaquimonas pukyongi]